MITEGISNKYSFVQNGDAPSGVSPRGDSSRIEASPGDTVNSLDQAPSENPGIGQLDLKDKVDLSTLKKDLQETDPSQNTDANNQVLQEAKTVVKDMVQELNEKFDRSSLKLRFDTDKESGLSYFQLYDKKNGDVVKQFPPEEMLEMVADLKQLTGVIFNENV